MSKEIKKSLQIFQDLKSVNLIIGGVTSSKIISAEEGELYASAARYFYATSESKISTNIESIRADLLSALEKDSQKWFGKKLNESIKSLAPTLTGFVKTTLTPAVIVMMGAAYDQDEKAAHLIIQRLCKDKAKLDSSFRLNEEQDNLAHIGAKANLPQLIKLLFNNKIFNEKQLTVPNKAKENPEFIALKLGNTEISDFIYQVTRPKITDASRHIVYTQQPHSLTQTLLTDNLNPLEL
jgi:hypothetical protein